MKNYFITIQYDGSAYRGWQRQKNTTNTIQSVIEDTLSRLLQENIEIHGSGRTDRGVHAYKQTANFKCRKISDMVEFRSKLNANLPSDIKVNCISEVDMKFHSRLSAVAKKYSYHIYCGERPSVFQRKYVYHYEKELDIEKMKEAANYLVGTHDFRGFSTEKNPEKSCIRSLYEVTIEENHKEIVICFLGSGFLYNMVRIMTGTLLLIGIGEYTIQDLDKALKTGKREFSGGIVPANGLFLEEVFYK